MNEAAPSVAYFDLKCAICGNREILEVQPYDPDGPSCSKCYGPMTVEGVATGMPADTSTEQHK